MITIQNKNQKEIDQIIAACLSDMDKIKGAIDEHGLPLRVDNYSGANVWTFNDKTTLKI